MKFELRTLSPIWTGDARKECIEARETGIVGSLRWWWEAILRGLDMEICDPMQSECNGRDKHCPACHIFGCTGWRKRFRLAVTGDLQPSFKEFSLNSWYIRGGLRTHKDQHKDQRFFLSFLMLSRDEEERRDVELILKLILSLISKWSGIGANTQHGFGTVSLLSGEINKEEIDEALKCIANLKNYKAPSHSQGRLPNLNEMFFCRICLESSKDKSKEALTQEISLPKEKKKEAIEYSESLDFIPSFYIVRDIIRRWFRNESIMKGYAISLPRGEDIRFIRHFYNGVAGREKPLGSKIYVSNLYRVEKNQPWELKIWGWVPDCKIDRSIIAGDKVIDLLENGIKSSNFQNLFKQKISITFIRKGSRTPEDFLRHYFLRS